MNARAAHAVKAAKRGAVLSSVLPAEFAQPGNGRSELERKRRVVLGARPRRGIGSGIWTPG
jgi:hypothetical protein